MTVRSVSNIIPDCPCYVLSRLTLLVFATVLTRPPITLGQQPSLTANLVAENPIQRQGILLLRNGQLLGGQYTLTGFGYEVRLKGGGVIRLRGDQVEFTSDSIDEIYLFQRASHVNSSASAHLKMANWCLANQLYEYADNHLKEAIRIDPREKGIIPIQSRLAIARSPQKATAPKTLIQHRPLASNETIAIRVNALEPSVIQSFVSRIQPLLLNRCAVAGCHGVNSHSEFRLLDSHWTKTTPKTISYRNLYNTTRYLNFANPPESRLLTQATTKHGKSRSAPLSLAEPAKINSLVNWVRLTTTVKEENHVKPASLQRPTNMGPIIFKKASLGSDGLQAVRITIPSETNNSTGSNDSDPVSSQNLQDTSLGVKILSSDLFQPVEFSQSFAGLPLHESSNDTLKIFSPKATETNNLTPSIDIAFPLPSDRVLKLIPISTKE